jgi:hypothetical protein
MTIDLLHHYELPHARKHVPADFYVALIAAALGLSLTGLGFALGLGVEIGKALGAAG